MSITHVEKTRHWNEILLDRDSASLGELASRYGVTPGQISAAFMRQGVTWASVAGARVKDNDDELPPEPGEEVGSGRSTAGHSEGRRPPVRPGSKDVLIAPHFELLGQRADAEVAAIAGVSVRTVASYRARNNIVGYKGPNKQAAVTVQAKPKARSSVPEVNKPVKPQPRPVAQGAAGRRYAWTLRFEEPSGQELVRVIVAADLVSAARKVTDRGYGFGGITLTYEGELIG